MSARTVMTIAAAMFAVGASCTVGCVPARRAELPQLQQRAVFDLGCPAQQLMLYHIDPRTKAVTGCGRRLVYLEQCDAAADNTCSWVLDSPVMAQSQWPPAMVAPSGQSARAGWSAKPAEARPMPTQLFESGQAPSSSPAGAGPGPQHSGKRTIRTDLYSSDSKELKGRPPTRPIRTDLFDAPPSAQPAVPPAGLPAEPPAVPPTLDR